MRQPAAGASGLAYIERCSEVRVESAENKTSLPSILRISRELSLRHQPLPSQQLAHRGPLVLAFEQFFPIVLGFRPGDQFPERGDVQDDTVVQIWLIRHAGAERLSIPEVLARSRTTATNAELACPWAVCAECVPNLTCSFGTGLATDAKVRTRLKCLDEKFDELRSSELT